MEIVISHEVSMVVYVRYLFCASLQSISTYKIMLSLLNILLKDFFKSNLFFVYKVGLIPRFKG